MYLYCCVVTTLRVFPDGFSLKDVTLENQFFFCRVNVHYSLLFLRIEEKEKKYKVTVFTPSYCVARPLESSYYYYLCQ